MVRLQGKYNTASIYASVIEEEAKSQIKELLNQPFVAGSHLAIMPDVHAGAGCVIGTTMTITDKVVPNLVGVDIGCGMLTVQLDETDIDLQQLDDCIHQKIPSGMTIRNVPVIEYDSIIPMIYHQLDNLRCKDYVNIERAKLSIGTLGGGNHFIEIDKDDNGHLYLIIHTGSRHMGLEIAKYYQDAAWQAMTKLNPHTIAKIVEDMKAQGRQKDIQAALADYKKNATPMVPKELAYCEGALFDDYMHDMKIAQDFASVNRDAIANTILEAMNLHETERFTTRHNYIDIENKILRKGAVSAQKDEILLIPINMRDGSLICRGKGNPDYNYSAPHGAGRLMSRRQARKQISIEEFNESMQGIYTTSVNLGTIDESPMAYKSIDDIIGNIIDTVEVLHRIRPIYNFKASE